MVRKYVVGLVLLVLLCVMTACGADMQPEELLTAEPTEVLELEATELQKEVLAEENPELLTEATETEETVLAETEETVPTEPEEIVLPPAERITDGVTVFLDTRNITAEMRDDQDYTKYEVYGVQRLRIESEQPFSSLYIEWDYMPDAYSIVWDGGSVACGEYGFMHEYIRLPEAVSAVEFSFDEDFKCRICNVELFTEGSTPEGVQDWLPPADGAADILVFPTHSDDDVLFFGPLISYYAIERELVVQTAFMVDHGKFRERGHERLDGLWEMGVRYYPILGSAPDSGRHEFDFGMSLYASYDIPGWQTEQIRRFKPLVVVGHDLEGEYGNCGHKVNAYYLTQTILDAADPEKYPESAQKYGTWDTPKLYLHLYPENEWYFDVNTPMENDPEGRTPFEVAVDAFQCHISQNIGIYKVEQDDNRREYDCRPFGLYRTLVGQDSVADIMDHIDPKEWK